MCIGLAGQTVLVEDVHTRRANIDDCECIVDAVRQENAATHGRNRALHLHRGAGAPGPLLDVSVELPDRRSVGRGRGPIGRAALAVAHAPPVAAWLRLHRLGGVEGDVGAVARTRDAGGRRYRGASRHRVAERHRQAKKNAGILFCGYVGECRYVQ